MIYRLLKTKKDRLSWGDRRSRWPQLPTGKCSWWLIPSDLPTMRRLFVGSGAQHPKAVKKTTQHWQFDVSVTSCSNVCLFEKKNHYIYIYIHTYTNWRNSLHSHHPTFSFLDVRWNRGPPQIHGHFPKESAGNSSRAARVLSGSPMVGMGTWYPRDVYA